MQKLFGTDGIRSRAGESPLDIAGLEKIALSYIKCLRQEDARDVVIGSDTRLSGHFIRNILCSFLNYHGINVYNLGIFTTPGIAFYCKHHGIPGIAVSASHNPYYDNGLKFFKKDANKEGQGFESAIESSYMQDIKPGFIKPSKSGFGITAYVSNKNEYFFQVKKALNTMINDFSIPGKKPRILFDLANGAAVSIKEIYESLPVSYEIVNEGSDGRSINHLSGSDHIACLKDKAADFDIIFSYDGDADRVIAMDRDGFIFNGDLIMTMFSLYLSRDKSRNRTAAGTIMTSLSVEKLLDSNGFKLYRSDVGDRNLKLLMDLENILIGGESSGHVIYRDYLPTGDGLFNSLAFLYIYYDPYIRGLIPEIKRACDLTKKKMDSFALIRKITPPELYSIIKREFSNLAIEIFNNSIVIRYESDFYSVVRLSGTEPKIRIFAESINRNFLDNFYDKLLFLLNKCGIVKN